jgi:hypothetical protein
LLGFLYALASILSVHLSRLSADDHCCYFYYCYAAAADDDDDTVETDLSRILGELKRVMVGTRPKDINEVNSP